MWFHASSQSRTFLRYALVVAGVFLIDLSLYMSLVWIGLSIYVANSCAFVCGTLLNIFLFRTFVFSRNRFSFTSDVVLSLCVYASIFLVGMGFLWFFFNVFHLSHFESKILANVFTFVINYLIRTLLFTRS
jgi:putative flippase GtrA